MLRCLNFVWDYGELWCIRLSALAHVSPACANADAPSTLRSGHSGMICVNISFCIIIAIMSHGPFSLQESHRSAYNVLTIHVLPRRHHPFVTIASGLEMSWAGQSVCVHWRLILHTGRGDRNAGIRMNIGQICTQRDFRHNR